MGILGQSLYIILLLMSIIGYFRTFNNIIILLSTILMVFNNVIYSEV